MLDPCRTRARKKDSIKEPVKLLALSILNERFGMTEKDFLRAEIEFVPAVKATDVGLDRSLVGAYGQDDKVCAYTALTAEMKAKSPEYTTVTILADKEEIGSVGNTGLNSDFTLHYIEGLCKAGNVDVRKVLKHSLCLSADVNAAYDPTFASVFEEKNSCYLNKGVVLTKYTGARGKSGSNDASAETMAKVIQIMDEAGVYWQIGELGAVDVGGGGTVACYMANRNIETVDAGVPVLSMHAPMEIVSKLDTYMTFKGMKVSDLLTIAAGKALSHDEACSYLTQVGLCARDYLNRDVDTSLSGGEVKRIEIATILAKNASLMLFDEPEAGIDLWSFARLTETFQRLHDEGGRTIIIISHQERIIRLADEILLISGGQVTGRGTADDIYPQILADTVTGCNMLEVDGTC